jgi:hypothetical protein
MRTGKGYIAPLQNTCSLHSYGKKMGCFAEIFSICRLLAILCMVAIASATKANADQVDNWCAEYEGGKERHGLYKIMPFRHTRRRTARVFSYLTQYSSYKVIVSATSRSIESSISSH